MTVSHNKHHGKIWTQLYSQHGNMTCYIRRGISKRISPAVN